MSSHEDKAKRYIGLLDAARINGSWSELPELIRKVNKHAPQQITLTQTATAEHYLATHGVQRPQTSFPSPSNPIETLRQTLSSGDNRLAEETCQGQTCLAWAAWAGIAAGSTDTVQVADIVHLFDRYGNKSTSAWTKICLLKAVVIQGQSHTQRGEEAQAHAIYKAATAWIELNTDLVKSIPQLAYWAEQVLAVYGTSLSDSTSLEEKSRTLRLWSAVTTKSQESLPATYGNIKAHTPRHAVWQSYYRTVSHNLVRSQHQSVPRSQVAAELRAVESAYETSFLKNHKFPKATESNAPVEEWVEQVIRNWQILCGPSWQEADLGEGGRNAVTRNVLDILYRAASKTFHSTLILRRLFQVHKSLTEFDLAYRCLDTYIDLTDRARARSAKSGESDPNQDSDEIMLLAVSEGVAGLCAFGRQKEAQKAFNLAMKLENWLEQIIPDHQDDATPNGHTEQMPTFQQSTKPPTNGTLQAVCRAIGIAKAHWARCTPFNENRSELQSEALLALHRACSLSEPQMPTLYALAVLCAETRDIPQAIKWTKIALQKIAYFETARDVSGSDKCVFWHLMTLLLSSQQDFDTALQSSAATLESLLGPGFGLQDSPNSSHSGPIGKHTHKALSAHLAADLECDDLQRVLEMQITYLALVELKDGPDAALNHSSDLLSLYSTLFKRFEVGDLKTTSQHNLAPPKSSAGTVKTTKGSMFPRRSKLSPSVAQSTTTMSLNATTTTSNARPATQASQAPTIQVTDETGKFPPKKHHHHSLVHRHHHDKDKEAKSGNRHSKTARPATATASPQKTEPLSDGTETVSTAHTNTSTIDHASPTSTNHDSQPYTKQPLDTIPHNITSHEKAAPPLGHGDQPPEQDVRLPTLNTITTHTSPIPRFPKALAQRHALVVLHKLWLTVSTLYRRAHIFEDAREAIEEAAKAASQIEAIVSAQDSSARILADAGWGGGGKSSDEVWADVYCSRAELLLAVAKRREEEAPNQPQSQSQSQSQPQTQTSRGEAYREIVEQYEHCLMYFPNHPSGITGLSNILLDYYEKKIDLAKKVDTGSSYGIRPAKSDLSSDDVLGPATTPSQEHLVDPFNPDQPFPSSSSTGNPQEDLRKTPENLNRIAARDRAYGLLSTLTKLGTGWDSSEAWFALARAHELGGEIERAKGILWWCIELEETRPVRHWRCLGPGGYVLECL